MNEDETRKLVEAIRRKGKEVASSKEAGIKLLQDAGIIDKDERPTARYRNLWKTCTVATQD